MKATDTWALPVPAGMRTRLAAVEPEDYINNHAIGVNEAWWNRELASNGVQGRLLGDRISRNDLFDLADEARKTQEAAFTLHSSGTV